MARSEGRTVSNMLLRLVGESVDARRLAAKSQSPEVKAIIAMLNAPASAMSVEPDAL
jgi:hypothetical protein